jgi:hypothetical protein
MDVAEIFGWFLQIVSYLVYGAIVVQFLAQKNNSERAKFVIIVVGLFAIIFVSEGGLPNQSEVWSFTFRQMAIMAFLAFTGIKLLIGRPMVLLIFIIYLVSFFTSTFFSFIAGAITYVLLSYGFIYSTLKIIQNRGN